MVQRFDFTAAPAADKLKRTPQGGIIASSHPTRVGVLSYKYPDGRTVLELRHPDEVFHPDSLASLAGAPVTIRHPEGGMVTSDNYEKLNKGSMADDVRKDGNFVAATVRIQSKQAAKMVERGDLKEMSCGYTADVDFTSGDFNGEKYDAIQKNIRYNHVALLPVGGGRAGRDVCLKLDSVEGDTYACSYASDMVHTDDSEMVSKEKWEALKEKHDGLKDEHDGLKKEHERVKGHMEAAKSELDEAKKAHKDSLEAASPTNIDKLVAARSAFLSDVRLVAGKTELKTDSKSKLEIMVEAITAAKPSIKLDGKSEDYVSGVFESLLAKESGVAAAHAAAQSVAAASKQDGADAEDLVTAARKRMLAHNASQYGMEKV